MNKLGCAMVMLFVGVASWAGPQHGSATRADIRRVSQSEQRFYSVNRDGVLRASALSANQEPPFIIELAVPGLRVKDDLDQPIAWSVSSGTVHFIWNRWDDRGEVLSGVIAKAVESLKPATDPLAPAPHFPPDGRVLGQIGGLNLYWKLAKKSENNEVGVDFVVDDGAAYTFIARVKETLVMDRDFMTTWYRELRSDGVARRKSSEIVPIAQKLPLPIQLAKAAGSKVVIDGDLQVHQLNDETLTLVGRLKPARSTSAQIVLIRNDDANETIVLEQIGDDLQVVRFEPEQVEFANPFETGISDEKKAAILALLGDS